MRARCTWPTARHVRTTTWCSVCSCLGDDGAERNAIVKFQRRFDLPLIAGFARFHHGEKRFSQRLGSDVLSLAMRLDQCGEPEVGCQTVQGHAVRSHCTGNRQPEERGGHRVANREFFDVAAPNPDVVQHTVIEPLELANSLAPAPFGSEVTHQPRAPHGERPQPFRSRAAGGAQEGLDGEIAGNGGPGSLAVAGMGCLKKCLNLPGIFWRFSGDSRKRLYSADSRFVWPRSPLADAYMAFAL